MSNYIFLFPIFFVGMAVGAMYVLAKKAWWGLAANYPFGRDFEGHRFGIISASVNGVNYNNCLLLKHNEQGIYLRPIFPFRLFHKGVLIPWQDIVAIRDKKVLFVSIKEIDIGSPLVATIKMKLSTFRKIEQATMLGSRVKISY
jgi:hypothetical protein